MWTGACNQSPLGLLATLHSHVKSGSRKSRQILTNITKTPHILSTLLRASKLDPQSARLQGKGPKCTVLSIIFDTRGSGPTILIDLHSDSIILLHPLNLLLGTLGSPAPYHQLPLQAAQLTRGQLNPFNGLSTQYKYYLSTILI